MRSNSLGLRPRNVSVHVAEPPREELAPTPLQADCVMLTARACRTFNTISAVVVVSVVVFNVTYLLL